VGEKGVVYKDNKPWRPKKKKRHVFTGPKEGPNKRRRSGSKGAREKEREIKRQENCRRRGEDLGQGGGGGIPFWPSKVGAFKGTKPKKQRNQGRVLKERRNGSAGGELGKGKRRCRMAKNARWLHGGKIVCP